MSSKKYSFSNQKEIRNIFLFLVFFIGIHLLTVSNVEAAKNLKEKTFKLLNGKYKPTSYEIKDFDIFNGGNSFFIWFSKRKATSVIDYVQINNKVYGPFVLNAFPKVSSDKKNLAFCYEKNNKLYIQINNKSYGPFPISFDSKCFFSDDFSRYGYTWEDKKNNARFFIVDGQKYGPFNIGKVNVKEFDVSRVDMDFPSVGSGFAFSFKKEDKYYVQFNETVLGPYDGVFNLGFLPDNKIFYYFENDNQSFVKVGEKIYGPYDSLIKKKSENNALIIEKLPTFFSISFFSSDKDQGYITFFSYKLNDKYYLKVGDKDFGPYDNQILLANVSQDMQKIAVVYLDPEQKYFYVKVDDNVFGPYVNTVFLQPIPFFSEDNSKITFYYLNSSDNKFYVKAGDKDYGPYEFVSSPIFLPGDNLFFIYILENKNYLRIGENIYGPYDELYIKPNPYKDSLDAFNVLNNLRRFDFEQVITLAFKKGKNWYLKQKNKTYGPYGPCQDINFFPKRDRIIFYCIQNNLLTVKEIKSN